MKRSTSRNPDNHMIVTTAKVFTTKLTIESTEVGKCWKIQQKKSHKWDYKSYPQIIYTPAKPTTNDKHKLFPLTSVVVQPLHKSCRNTAGTPERRQAQWFCGRPSRLHLLALPKGSTNPPDLLVVSLSSEQISGSGTLFLDRMTQKVGTAARSERKKRPKDPGTQRLVLLQRRCHSNIRERLAAARFGRVSFLYITHCYYNNQPLLQPNSPALILGRHTKPSLFLALSSTAF
jgi:hypothetical protein